MLVDIRKTNWSWNRMYQALYEKAKMIVKRYSCMTFYDATRPLYLETKASINSLGTGLLQVRDGMNCSHDEVSNNAIL